MSTFPGASSDLLASLAILDSPSFSSLNVDHILQAVPPYGPAMYSSLKRFAENQKLLEAAIFQKEMEEFRTQLQGEQHRSRELEKHLNEAKAEISSLERESTSEYGRLSRKLKDGEGLVATLPKKIHNKDGRIDRQASEIEELRAELTRYQSFEYVPEELDNLRAEVSRLQRVSAGRLLLIGNLEGQCNSLRLWNRDLHADRKFLLRLKDEARIYVQQLEDKLRLFDQISRDLEWTQLQLSGLQIARDHQQAWSSDHKKHRPSNEFNEQEYDGMVLKMCELDTSLFNSEETLKLVLPTLLAEQAKVKALEEQVVQLKQNEALLNTKISDAAAAELTLQLDEAQKKHIMEITDWIKEGMKAYIDEWRHKKAAENAGSGSANLET